MHILMTRVWVTRTHVYTYTGRRGRKGEEEELTKNRVYIRSYSYSTGRDLSATYRDVRQNHTDFLDAWLCLRHLVKRRARGGMSSYHSIGPFETFLRSSQPFVGSHLLILTHRASLYILLIRLEFWKNTLSRSMLLSKFSNNQIFIFYFSKFISILT